MAKVIQKQSWSAELHLQPGKQCLWSLSVIAPSQGCYQTMPIHGFNYNYIPTPVVSVLFFKHNLVCHVMVANLHPVSPTHQPPPLILQGTPSLPDLSTWPPLPVHLGGNPSQFVSQHSLTMRFSRPWQKNSIVHRILVHPGGRFSRLDWVVGEQLSNFLLHSDWLVVSGIPLSPWEHHMLEPKEYWWCKYPVYALG